MKSASKKIDISNIGLMIISCISAFIFPFELFLFSYAVLGPLHYLTEINWLHKKGYYTTGKYDFLFLGILGGLIALGALGFSKALGNVFLNFVYIAFMSALVMVLIKDTTLKFIMITLIVFSTIFLSDTYFYGVFFAIFLPTIIHVFIFTGLFILLGAIKNRSFWGFLSVLVFIICAISFFFLRPGYIILSSEGYISESLQQFFELNRQLVNFFRLAEIPDLTPINKLFLIHSEAGVVVMRFIAFAYTYHYLNWFSKTSVIKWHNVSGKTLTITGVIWVISVMLYAKSYDLGLKWLYFLSFLHVLLEFPLNYRSILGIGEELLQMVKSRYVKSV